MRVERVGLTFAIALHGFALAALLAYAPARQALLAAAPLMVSLIRPAKVAGPTPALPTEQPKPKPVHRAKPAEPVPAPVVAAPVEAPAPALAPAPPAAPAAPVQAAPAPAIVTPPDFNAAYLNNPKPAYPPISKRLHEQGRVVLRVHVTAAGGVDDIQLRTSSGSPRLDDAAREAVLRWKFVPAKHGAESVAAWVLVPIPFVLIGS